jgi:hypothetical protein
MNRRCFVTSARQWRGLPAERALARVLARAVRPPVCGAGRWLLGQKWRKWRDNGKRGEAVRASDDPGCLTHGTHGYRQLAVLVAWMAGTTMYQPKARPTRSHCILAPTPSSFAIGFLASS